ncbi:MAG TPA: hypothetical protein VGL10_04220 [Gammaproteobacteria bacterium]
MSCLPVRFLIAFFIFNLTLSTISSAADLPGGFIEHPSEAEARPALSASQVNSFLPTRGAFKFPAPYNTAGVRITNASDCGGSDCVLPVGYSYWRNINNHVGSDTMYIFVSLNRNSGGSGPTLFSYNKQTEEVKNLGELFDSNNAFGWSSGEGWYFSGTKPTALYVNDGPKMQRYDVLSKKLETVFDVTTEFGSGHNIWQMHSSDNDKVHSATLRNSSYQMLGCVVYHEDTEEFQYFPKAGNFDECHLDKSGDWLLSLEDIDGRDGLEMRVIELATEDERVVNDREGAVGHADMGYGYVLGADNWSTMSNAYKVWDFEPNTLLGDLVVYNNEWSAPGPNHISHTNARSGAPDEQYACGSGASNANAVWGNEVVCFRLDGSYNTLIVAPVMTNMNASSGGDSYSKQPKGNLDVTGQYFVWTANSGGNRMDAFIVKVPAQLLGVSVPSNPGSGGGSSGGGSGNPSSGGSNGGGNSSSGSNGNGTIGGAGAGDYAFIMLALLYGALFLRRTAHAKHPRQRHLQ